MKSVVVLFAIFGFAFASPAKLRPETIPEENSSFGTKYLIYRDEAGKFHFEDLTRDVPTPRTTIDDVTIYFYTRKNQDKPEVFKTGDLSGLLNSRVYDSKKPSYFIIHGLNNNFESAMFQVLRPAILDKIDVNVFVVDWSPIANKNYLTAKGAVPQIGKFVGDFINRMMDYFKLPTTMFRIIGHSLGAHVSGVAGAEVTGLADYIIGLDPAGPLFTVANKDNRLDASDADHVHIIHTSTSTLGFSPPIGDVDIYPNGGSSQPGCGLDLIGTCAHSRAYYYLAESIHSGGFGTVNCHNYKAFRNGECDHNHSSKLGSLDVDRSASGVYYLDTNSDYPFSLS
ncbi:hypothetical protein ILUMI_23070 [Ignelater luminosus]|uniref:Lipase domain-containing protein n=1 Tax=Ignelater luminosus TaxID=2038154 RepID=A0A8K0CEJ9_IGNLU|nr:hypothetical protein ILUMI_23070 [Ignelater luminosus]